MALRLLLLLICLPILNPAFASPSEIANLIMSPVFDEEYDRYKREGDELFRKGEYEQARKKFLACLLIPKFENDPYAKGRVQSCVRAIQLRQEGETALAGGKGSEAVERFKQLLQLNPDDLITRKSLADYWQKEANLKYAAKNYIVAKARYEEALKYAIDKQIIELQIQNCVEKIAVPKEESKPKEEPKPKEKEIVIAQHTTVTAPEATKPLAVTNAPETPNDPKPLANSKPELQISKVESTTAKKDQPQQKTTIQSTRSGGVGTKVLVGLIGVGAGGYAYLLNRQWQDKLSTLNSVSQTVDPDNDGVILNQTAYNQWKTANEEAKTAQSKHGLFLACIGTAVGSALLETFLILRKPKQSSGFTITPSSMGMGVAIQLRF